MEIDKIFQSGSYDLRGLFDQRFRDHGVVMTHPHSLYGGDMQNPVVKAMVTACAAKGYATFRFDFRIS